MAAVVEAIFGGERLKQRNRLLAIAGVKIEVADLLALQLVEAALLPADIFDDLAEAVPIGGRRIKHPGKHGAPR